MILILFRQLDIVPRKYYLYFCNDYCDDLKVQDYFQDRLPDDFDKNPRCLKRSADSGSTEEEQLWKLKENVLKALHQSDSAPYTGSVYPNPKRS
jgi:hypothetical protein